MNIEIVENFTRFMTHIEVGENFDERKVKEIRVKKNVFLALEVSSNVHYHRMYRKLPNIPHTLAYTFFGGTTVPIIEDNELDVLGRIIYIEESKTEELKIGRKMTYTNHEKVLCQLRSLGERVEGWMRVKSDYNHPLMSDYREETKKALDFRTEELNELIDKVVDAIIEIRKGK